MDGSGWFWMTCAIYSMPHHGACGSCWLLDLVFCSRKVVYWHLNILTTILFISPCERRVDDPWVWFFVQKKMYIV